MVSIILPCYNAESTIEKAVRSILNQTYINFELIITNDCSVDSSYKILHRLSCEDDRIKLINNSTNCKLIKCLNHMISVSKGKYIARMDADDYSDPRRIEYQVDYLEQTPSVVGCGTSINIIDELDQIIAERIFPDSLDEIKWLLPYYLPFCHSSMMLRADVLKNNLYSEEYIDAEDYELWCRLLFSNYGLTNLSKKLLNYRVSAKQISKKNYNSQIATVNKVIKMYKLVPKEYIELHCKIFYPKQDEINDIDINKLKQFLSVVFTESKKWSKNTRRLVVIKILYYLKISKKYVTLFRFMFSTTGIDAILHR